MQEALAQLKNARISAQKARLVVDMIRGLPVERALDKLTFSTKKAAGMVKKLLRSAVANAEHNHGLDIDALVIRKIYVDEASSFKRFMARAKGRGNRILKQNCHITIVVAA